MRDHAERARRQESELDDRLRTIRTGYQRGISHDPVKRAAWDLLAGPGTDWDALRREDAYINPQKHEWHIYHPDMILPFAAGAGHIDWQAHEGGDLSHPNPPPAACVPGAEGGESRGERVTCCGGFGKAARQGVAFRRDVRQFLRAGAQRVGEGAVFIAFPLQLRTEIP